MAKAKTTIELNGQLYDARTGKIIGGNAMATAHSIPVSANKTVDGFSKRPGAVQAPIKTVAVKPIPAVVAAPAVPSPRPKPDIARTAPSHAHKHLEKSKTLMRPAVRKPGPISESKPAANFKKVNHERSARASVVEKSPHVKRFHPVTAHKVVKKEAVVPMASPRDKARNHLSEQVAQLAVSTETRVKQSVDIIEESLRNASSHLETFEGNAKKSLLNRTGFKNKAANLASLSFAGLLLVGFFAYQNSPNIEMRVAANRSGVAAQMPDYSPSGFSAIRGVKSGPGKVSVTFKSNTDNKSFTVSQQASNWSSESLLTNQVASANKTYQTYQEGGRTVYISENGTNATWVNGGVLYNVNGDASLSTDQMLKIANSL